MRNYLGLIAAVLMIGLSSWLLSGVEDTIEEIPDFAVKVLMVFIPLMLITIGLYLIPTCWNDIQKARLNKMYEQIE
jgi:hypothetical protein